MRRTTPNKPITVGVLLLCLLGLTLSCGVGGLAATSSPRWACPSPTPRPFGPDGPVKAQQPLPTAEPAGPQEYAPVYYEEWEQEYGPGGSLLGANDLPYDVPFPSPTPYVLLGTNYTFGQRVEIAPLHLTVSARAGASVERPGVPSGTQQLYLVELTWVNPTGAAIPIDYAERVRLRAVTSPRGAIITDANWGLSSEALQTSQLSAPPTAIPSGESQVIVPILGPIGEPKTVDVVFATGAAPTAEITPTPNTDLRSTAPQFLTVQWSDTTLRVGPPCADAGALTSWDDAPGVAWGHPAAIGLAAPPGAARIVQLALAQVGKPYVWGAKGPERFDCSGLVSWLYAQIGLAIPLGTAGQWPRLAPVATEQLQPGDLVFFDIAGSGHVDHVGMLIGDLNGDGRWDMVHAANPALGVRIDYGVLQSPYYTARIAGFRTVRVP